MRSCFKQIDCFLYGPVESDTSGEKDTLVVALSPAASENSVSDRWNGKGAFSLKLSGRAVLFVRVSSCGWQISKAGSFGSSVCWNCKGPGGENARNGVRKFAVICASYIRSMRFV